jgi:hypothetical protein
LAYSIYSFDHDWSTPVVEHLEWLTDVIRKRSGLEQRIGLRAIARRTLDYVLLVGGEDDLDERRAFDAFMWDTQNEDVIVPIWSDAIQLTGTLAATSTNITFMPKGYDYDDTGYVMFWRAWDDYEVVAVTGISISGSGRVDFDAVTETWTAGATMVPARLCRHNPTMKSSVFASDIQAPTPSFEVLVSATPATANYRAIAPTLDQYRSTDVLDTSGMDGQNQRTLESTVARVDYMTGQWSADSIQNAPFGTIDYAANVSGRTEIYHLLGWLNGLNGRRKAFWFPTWEQDFAIVERIDDTDFTADNLGYTTRYGQVDGFTGQRGEARRDIGFYLDDGATFVRIVDSEDNAPEEFEVDGTLPIWSTDPEDDLPVLDRVSFLRYCRLDQDAVELSWATNDDLETKLSFRELPRTA